MPFTVPLKSECQPKALRSVAIFDRFPFLEHPAGTPAAEIPGKRTGGGRYHLSASPVFSPARRRRLSPAVSVRLALATVAATTAARPRVWAPCPRRIDPIVTSAPAARRLDQPLSTGVSSALPRLWQ